MISFKYVLDISFANFTLQKCEKNLIKRNFSLNISYVLQPIFCPFSFSLHEQAAAFPPVRSFFALSAIPYIIYASYFRSRNLQLLSPKIIFEGGSCRFFVQKSFFL